MKKKLTGVQYTPEEFRKLEQCISCLHATSIEYGGRCGKCYVIEFKYCEMCDVVMREGIHRFYSYDNRDIHRENGIEFLASKEPVREFIFEEDLPPLEHPTLCNDCIGWEAKMKDICWFCDNDFDNSKENYKLNGNMCLECSAQFQDPETNVQKVNNYQFAG